MDMAISSGLHRGEVYAAGAAQHQPHGTAAALWTWLAQLDQSVRAPEPDTVGSVAGARLRMQWWCDPTGEWFAAQVMDTITGGVWEVFKVPAGSGQPVAGRRLCLGGHAAQELLDTLWLEVFAGSLSEPLPSARFPAFAELVAAGANPQGVTAVRDASAQLEHLQQDLEYWKNLAVSLSKVANGPEATYPLAIPPAAEPAPPEGLPEPREWGLKDIGDWAKANQHRIVIMPRAISATKRSNFEDPALLYAALELLASEYTQVKTGAADRMAYKTKAEELGLDFAGSVDPSVAGEMGDLYFVRWGGRRRFLDQHLRKGSARDPRFCMRIYFCYDEEACKVVVGHMPSHLPTSRT